MNRLLQIAFCALILAGCAQPRAVEHVAVAQVYQYVLELRDFDEEEASHLVKSLSYYNRISISPISINTENMFYQYALWTELSAQNVISRSYSSLSRIDLTTGNLNVSYYGNRIIFNKLNF